MIPIMRFAMFVLVLITALVTGCRSKSKGGPTSPDARAAAVVHGVARALDADDQLSFRALWLLEKHCRHAGLSPADRPTCLQMARSLPARVKGLGKLSPATAAARRGYQGFVMKWPSTGGGLRQVARRPTRVRPGAMEVPQAELSIFVVGIGAHYYVYDLRQLRTFGRSGRPD